MTVFESLALPGAHLAVNPVPPCPKVVAGPTPWGSSQGVSPGGPPTSLIHWRGGGPLTNFSKEEP
jgi:hypothetical protein